MNKIYVVVDIETTGLSPQDNEIIEIGAVKVSGGKVRGKYHSLVKPQRNIPNMIQKLTGITQDMVLKAPPFEEIADKFKKFVGNNIFVAHNAGFDFKTINTSLRRAGRAELDAKVIDTQELVIIVYPTLSSHRLSVLAQKLGIDIEDKHRALVDAGVTAKIFLMVLEEIKKMKVVVLREILKLSYGSNWPPYDLFFEALKKSDRHTDSVAYQGACHFLRPVTEVIRKKKKRTEIKVSIALDQVNKFFKKGGALEKNIKGYEERMSQIEMVNAISAVLNRSGHLVIEAGTGTGKSLAYLYPAILFSLNNNKPVVISTRTKNLQEQLIDKDIPLLKKSIPKDFYAVVVKGMENYFCLRKWDMHYRLIAKKMVKEDLSHLFGFLNWLSITQTGDITELHSMLYYKAYRNYRSEARACSKEKCAFFGRCFHSRNRRAAQKADIIIVNHSLLFSDINGRGNILPSYDQLVLDEAHNIEDVATESFSVVISSRKILDNLKRLVEPKGSFSILEEVEIVLREAKDLEAIEKIKQVNKEIYKRMDSAFKTTRRSFEGITSFVHAQRLKEIGQVNVVFKKNGELWKLIVNMSLKSQPKWEIVKESINDIKGVIVKIIEALEELKKVIEEKLVSRKIEDVYLDVAALIGEFQDMIGEIDFVFNDEENYISWIEVDTNSSPWTTTIISAPINVGDFIYENIFSKKENVILTSATLSVNGGFDFLKSRIGLLEQEVNLQEVKLGTEFDYESQAVVCVPKGVNIVKENTDLGRIADLLARIIILTQGRTLVLFTSYKMLQDVYFLAQEILRTEDIHVYCQGRHGSRRSILERFKGEKKSVVFGTDSFWEGVDLPGSTLSCLVMMKLPFAVPTEPIVLARTEEIEFKGKNGFLDYAVPHAVIKFRQGIGRLIRTKKDKGIIVIFDNRLYEKSYGHIFLNSIPDYYKIYELPEEIIGITKNWLEMNKL